MSDFIGRPTISDNSKCWPLVTDDQLLIGVTIPGIVTPHRLSSLSVWSQLPVADNANTVSIPLNAYGQWSRSVGDPPPPPQLGDWVEWDIAVPGTNPNEGYIGFLGRRFMHLIYPIGFNLGKFDVSFDGVYGFTIDQYSSTFAYPFITVGYWIPDYSDMGPRKIKVRFTVVDKNPSSSNSYILLSGLTIMSVTET